MSVCAITHYTRVENHTDMMSAREFSLRPPTHY